jgi:hypothetical protein
MLIRRFVLLRKEGERLNHICSKTLIMIAAIINVNGGSFG